MTIKTNKSVRLMTGAAAVVAVFAVAAPLAQASSHAAACAAGASTATVSQSPSADWVSVTDEQGVPYLEPASMAPAVTTDCAEAAPVTTAHNEPTSFAISMRSPYPGWTVVADDLGVPWLVPAALTH
jgi:hypothetical protein